MSDLFPLFSAGLADALNPCQMGTLAVFILFLGWAAKDVKKTVQVSCHFILVNLTLLLSLRTGLEIRLFHWASYEMTVTIYYILLGVICVAVAFWLLKDWSTLVRGKRVELSFFSFLRRGMPGGKFVFVLSALLSAWTAWMAIYWPPSAEVTVAANNAFLPGKFYSTLLALTGYELFRQWPLVAAVAIYVGFLNSGSLMARVRERFSLACVAAAGFYAAVGAGLLYYFLSTLF